MSLTKFDSDSNQSPFDSIRHMDEQGNEFWYARELMPLLGYKAWQKFNKVIENAIENLETVTEQVNRHIISKDNVVKRPQGGGTKLLDYKLSRLACYHVALSCDSRGNDSVKMAKHYFAIKTREAELKQQKPMTAIELAEETIRLAQEQLQLLLEIERQKMIINDLEEENEVLSEIVDELFDYSSIIRIAKYNQVSETNFNWRNLKAASQQLGLEIKVAPCPRFGTKNIYPHEAWRLAYPDVELPETTNIRLYDKGGII